MPIGAPSIGTFLDTASTSSPTAVPFPAVVPANGVSLMLGSITNPGSTGIGPITGWTQLFQASPKSGANNPDIGLFRLNNPTTGSEGGTTVSVPHSVFVNAFQITVWTGVDLISPIIFTPGTHNVDQTASASMVLPSLTTDVAGCTLIGGGGLNSNNQSCTPTSGWTEIGDHGSGSRSMEWAYLQNVAKGAQGTKTFTWGTSARSYGFILALRPAPVHVRPGPPNPAAVQRAATF